MKIKEPFKCSLCGWIDNRKKPYPYDDINEHFINAKEIWCPRNICKETYKRTIPRGYVCKCWYAYGEWCTLEEKPKVIDFETAQATYRAKQIKNAALHILNNQKK